MSYIHQIWFELKPGGKPPADQQALSEEITHLSGETHTHIIWTLPMAEELVDSHYPQFRSLWNQLIPIQKIDFLRFLFLHRYGGWYLDYDVRLTKPMDEVERWVESSLRTAEAYIVQTPNCVNIPFLKKSHLSNCIMYSPRPGSPVWMELAKEVAIQKHKHWWEPRHYYIMRSTGPRMVSITIPRLQKMGYHISELPKRWFNPIGLCSKQGAGRGAFTIHTNAGGWEKGDSTLIKSLWCNMYTILAILIIVFIIWFYFIKSKRSQIP